MADGDEVRPRSRAAVGARDAGSFAGVDLDSRVTIRSRATDAPVRRADGRHAVHRRRRPPRSARVARLERRASWRACSTTRCATSCCRCRTTRSCIRRTAPARCAARTSRPTPCRRSAMQRTYNYALQPMSRERFIEIVTSDQPDTPAYFTYDAVLNARERPTLDEALERELRPLSLDRLLELPSQTGRSCSTRASRPEFEGAHICGARQHRARRLASPHGAGRSSTRAAGRARRRARARGRGGDAARADRRSTPSPATSTGGMQQLDDAPGPHRTDREDHRGFGSPSSWTHRTRRCSSTCAPPRSTAKLTSTGAVNVPLSQLSERVGELPSDRADRRLLRERLPLGDRREPAQPRRDCHAWRTWSAASRRGIRPSSRPWPYDGRSAT